MQPSLHVVSQEAASSNGSQLFLRKGTAAILDVLVDTADTIPGQHTVDNLADPLFCQPGTRRRNWCQLGETGQALSNTLL